MCARFILLDEAEVAEIGRIVQEVGMKYDGKGISMKTGEIFPTDYAPVVSLENGKPSLFLMKWGFPKPDGKGVVINARSETAPQKRMFSASFARRRCVIPSNGFIEWTKDRGNAKQKILFGASDCPMLYMAGLYDSFPAENEHEPLLDRFVILTRQADESVGNMHSRMPVILQKNEIRLWLTDTPFAKTIMSRDTAQLIHTAAEAA